jgi:glutamyl-tRNA synthetase
MVMGSDGLKLSKRHGATSVNDFRAKGYLPAALVNYIAMVGCSYEDGRDIFSLPDLERLFSVEHLNKAPAVFDYKKLDWFNGQYMRLLPDADLLDAMRPFMTDAGFYGTDICDAEIDEKLLEVMPLIKERIHFLAEAPELVAFLFKEPPVPAKADLIPKKLDEAATKKVLEAAITFVQKLPGVIENGHEAAEEFARTTAESLGLKLGDFMMPIRWAVTGSRISPPLIGSIAALGTAKAVARIKRVLEQF